MPIADRTDMYRMKALACEQQASDASDPDLKTGLERVGKRVAHDGESCRKEQRRAA